MRQDTFVVRKVCGVQVRDVCVCSTLIDVDLYEAVSLVYWRVTVVRETVSHSPDGAPVIRTCNFRDYLGFV